nr:MAG TPA: hypothetical protein [Caudoviricetes sp.]
MEQACIVHESGSGNAPVTPRSLGYASGDDKNSYLSYTADKDMLVYARCTVAWSSGGWGNTEIRFPNGGTQILYDNTSLQNLDGNKRDKWAEEIKIVSLKKGNKITLAATGTNYLRSVCYLYEIGTYVDKK